MVVRVKVTRQDDGTFTAEMDPGDIRYDALTARALVIFPAAVEFGAAFDTFGEVQQRQVAEAIGRALMNGIRDSRPA